MLLFDLWYVIKKLLKGPIVAFKIDLVKVNLLYYVKIINHFTFQLNNIYGIIMEWNLVNFTLIKYGTSLLGGLKNEKYELY